MRIYRSLYSRTLLYTYIRTDFFFFFNIVNIRRILSRTIFPAFSVYFLILYSANKPFINRNAQTVCPLFFFFFSFLLLLLLYLYMHFSFSLSSPLSFSSTPHTQTHLYIYIYKHVRPICTGRTDEITFANFTLHGRRAADAITAAAETFVIIYALTRASGQRAGDGRRVVENV